MVTPNIFTVNYQVMKLISHACLIEVGQSVLAVEKITQFLDVVGYVSNDKFSIIHCPLPLLFWSLLISAILSLIFLLGQFNCMAS